jgi:hypothetical protein
MSEPERLDEDVPYHGGEATERAPTATGTSGGSGEHPDPNAPPTGSAGTAPGGTDAPQRRTGEPFEDEGTSSPQPASQQTGEVAGDRGPARSADMPDRDNQEATAPTRFKDVLDAVDPVTAGARATPVETTEANDDE